MMVRLTALAVASVALRACLGGDGTADSHSTRQTATPSHQAPREPTPTTVDAPSGLDAWTDRVQAVAEGDAAAYLKSIAVRATSLDDLSDEALRQRLVALVEPLAEEARWWGFVHTLMPTECVRTLGWRQVTDMKTRLGALIDLNLSDLEAALREGSPRHARQSAVILGERELPVIRELRRPCVDSVLTNVFRTRPLRESSSLQEIRALLRES